MDGTLVEPLPATEPADLSELVRQLCREVLDLRQEVNELRRENAELRQQAGYWKADARSGRASGRATRSRGRAASRREPQAPGSTLRSKERKTASSRTARIVSKGKTDPAPSTPPKRGQRRDRPGPPRRDYSHLPVVEELRELPEDQRVCPQCGAALSPSDTEDSEQIEIEVRAYRRRIRRRRYQRTCSCSNCPRTFTAAPAPKLIPKGLLGVSVWVEILLDKFASHRPTERLLAQWRLLGLDVAAGTVAGGLERLEPLLSAALRRAA